MLVTQRKMSCLYLTGLIYAFFPEFYILVFFFLVNVSGAGNMESLQFFCLCVNCTWEGFQQCKQCFVCAREDLEFDVFSLFSPFPAVHRSVLCDDDPPWCHSDRHTTNHRATHTALPCVSVCSVAFGEKEKHWYFSLKPSIFWKQTNCWSIFVKHLLWIVQLKSEGQVWLNFKSVADCFLMCCVQSHSQLLTIF